MGDFFFMKSVLDSFGDVLSELRLINQEVKKMSISLDNLVNIVNQTKTVEDSVVVILNDVVVRLGELSALLANEPVVQAQVDQLAAGLQEKTTALAAAAATVPPA